jgi:hypothetical protein
MINDIRFGIGEWKEIKQTWNKFFVTVKYNGSGSLSIRVSHYGSGIFFLGIMAGMVGLGLHGYLKWMMWGIAVALGVAGIVSFGSLEEYILLRGTDCKIVRSRTLIKRQRDYDLDGVALSIKQDVKVDPGEHLRLRQTYKIILREINGNSKDRELLGLLNKKQAVFIKELIEHYLAKGCEKTIEVLAAMPERK